MIILGSLLPNMNSAEYPLRFEGLDDKISLVYGDSFDYTDDVKLYRNKTKLNGEISYSGSVDTHALGEYEITYTGKYDDEIITKTVKVEVIPFYIDYNRKIAVLKRFKIEKRSNNSYTVSGTIVNKSDIAYSKLTINYYCTNNSTNYQINFDEGLPIGSNDFSIVLTSTEPFLTYDFKINSIELS